MENDSDQKCWKTDEGNERRDSCNRNISKPSVKQIIEAIEDKYGVTVSSCHCGYANFEIEKLN